MPLYLFIFGSLLADSGDSVNRCATFPSRKAFLELMNMPALCNSLDPNQRDPDPERLLRYPSPHFIPLKHKSHLAQRIFLLDHHSELYTRLAHLRFCISASPEGLVSITCKVKVSEVRICVTLSWIKCVFFFTDYRQEFEKIVDGLSDSLEFSRTIGIDAGSSGVSYEQGGGRGTLGEVDFYSRCVFLFL